MAESVEFPDVELAVCAALRHPLIGLPVVGDVPSIRPQEFIRVMRTGGPKETLKTEAAQVTVEAWAQKKDRASQLLNRCRAILNRAEGTLFGVIELSGPANLPDPTTAQIRYTMSFQIRAHGAAVTV
ncbi:hypothetical protein J7I84_08845 [Arthrobacter sp. ISL-85]|uniref:hypothetical protein n=1 Tax=Arthrobacter sp. ISL-85 TaxID=2819115 RepID=UPI001BEC1C6B|nr:hypothetical protein [Arthrobacter sp. ISL-85]MBT2566599.1 hypothetical protein [Arthrobacter sp. ISL-85]